MKITYTQLCRRNLYKRLGLDDFEVSDSIKVSRNIKSANKALDELIRLAQ